MEMYRFVAVCENDSTSKQLTYTPENFEGVKINREFSFVPPYGFTPKFAVDTMRVIKDDAAFFIAKNVAFGYFLKMKLYVSKLNADGMTYSPFITLVVNYETISQTKDYCEFSVDVINTATDYFNTKSTPKNILFNTYKMPAGTYYKINNVNVNSIPTTSQISGKRLMDFEKSEGINIIFDGDLSLYDVSTIDAKNVIYQSELISSLRVAIKTSIMIDVFMSIGATPSGTVQVGMQILSGVNASVVSTVWSETRNVTKIGERFEFIYDIKRNPTLQGGEFLVFYLKVQGLPSSGNASVAQNNVGVTVKKQTILEYPLKALKSISLTNLFGEIFGDISFTDPRTDETWITSDREVVTNTGNMVASPQDIARELSIAYGFVYNFNETETKIEQITDYFERLNLADRIKIETYKDLSIINYETVYNSLTTGVEKFNTENIVYFEPIQTKLRWLKVNRDDVVQQSLGDDMELVCTKLSPDSEKIINRIYDAAIDNGQSSNDNFYLVPQNIGEYSDILTPNGMANNHFPLLALHFGAFYNFGDYVPYELKAVDNDGIGDLKDYFIGSPDFWSKKQLKPFVYEFTALIGEVDFSEHFAEMVDFNGDTVDLFVYSSETTDQLGEIKCKALVFK